MQIFLYKNTLSWGNNRKLTTSYAKNKKINKLYCHFSTVTKKNIFVTGLSFKTQLKIEFLPPYNGGKIVLEKITDQIPDLEKFSHGENFALFLRILPIS